MLLRRLSFAPRRRFFIHICVFSFLGDFIFFLFYKEVSLRKHELLSGCLWVPFIWGKQQISPLLRSVAAQGGTHSVTLKRGWEVRMESFLMQNVLLEKTILLQLFRLCFLHICT